MCGIFGIIFKEHKKDLGTILLQAGRRLTYRGYDSVGMAAFTEDSVELRKDVGEIEEVNRKHRFEELEGYKGIVQLRWATFGPPSKNNSQPHFDCTRLMVGAHNGNIINTKELISEYKKRGHSFRGENDGEVIVHVLEELYNEFKKMSIAIEKASSILKGDYAYVVTRRDMDKMYCVKKYSSLYLGVGDDFICCSSDLPSIIPLTDLIVPIYDGEYVELNWENYKIKDIFTGREIKREPVKRTLNIEEAKKGEFSHFMIKEIYEQPQKSKALLDFLMNSSKVEEFCAELKREKRIYLVGSGSSYNACVIGSYYLNKIAEVEAFPVMAGAFKEFINAENLSRSTFILVSQSGETKDVISALNYLEEKGVKKILAIVNVLGSSLHLRVKNFLPLLTNIEISVPATKTFTNQVIIFLYLALKLRSGSGGKNPIEKIEILSLPSLIEKTISLNSEKCQKIASHLYRKKYLYYLGFGINYGACLEAALKMKEVTYIPCEGIYSSEFKHGPLAIIKEGDWVLFISSREDSLMTLSHINEIRCRKGRVCTLSPPDDSLALNSDETIFLPSLNYYFSPILSVIIAQLLAYYISLKKGINPDQPQNISKTLTVD